MKLDVTASERGELVRLSAKGSARERKRATVILTFATGNWSYRAARTALRVSKSTLSEAVERFRNHSVSGLLQAGLTAGRPTKMSDPAVREFVAKKLADGAAKDAQGMVKALDSEFGIELSPTSLPRWLRKWGLKLPRRPRTIPTRDLLPQVQSYLNRELGHIGKQLAKLEKECPEWKEDIRCLRIQQDQILAVLKSGEAGYTQASIADELERPPTTICRWLKLFWGGGADVAAAKRLASMHET